MKEYGEARQVKEGERACMHFCTMQCASPTLLACQHIIHMIFFIALSVLQLFRFFRRLFKYSMGLFTRVHSLYPVIERHKFELVSSREKRNESNASLVNFLLN